MQPVELDLDNWYRDVCSAVDHALWGQTTRFRYFPLDCEPIGRLGVSDLEMELLNAVFDETTE